MPNRSFRRTRRVSLANETLEPRVVLSGGAQMAQAAEVSALGVRNAATQTTLAVSAGTLGQPITFTVTVRASASAGSPRGTVNLIDHGQVIQTLTLSPTTSTSSRYAFSKATFTLNQPSGDSAYAIGRHLLSAVYTPAGGFAKSRAVKAFNVTPPVYTPLANGVKIATIATGSGSEIQPGQNASVLYSGYLAKNGQLFDDSAQHGGTPLRFTLGAGQLIPGFDAGTVGMKIGETRIISIPPAQGYGSTANGPIPANSTLLFVVTLVGIS